MGTFRSWLEPPIANLSCLCVLLGQEVDLSGINILESDSEFLKTTAQRVQFHADTILRQGLESLNQADVGNALQVYFNLDELSPAVSSLMARGISGIEHKAKQALDLRHALTGAAGGNSGGWQEIFWTRVRDLTAEMEKSVVSTWHLQQVLRKKKDPISHVLLLDVVVNDSQETVLSDYWGRMVKTFGTVIGNVVHPSKAAGVRDTLIQGFPTLCSILEAMFEKVKVQCQTKGSPSAIEEKHMDLLFAACQPIEKAYLAASLTRMSEAVTVAFPGGTRTLPSPPDVQKCIARVHEELKAAEGSLHAAALVASTVGKAIVLLAERVGLMASAGSEVATMGGSCTSAQSRNITLFSHVQDVHRALVSVIPKLSLMAAQALVHPMEALKEGAIGIVAPIFKAAVENLEQAILEIHATTNHWSDESSSGEAKTAATIALPAYVKELEVKLLSFRNEYLMKFTPVPIPSVPSFATSLVKRMACRVLVYFVRHAALIRPLGSKGRQQLSRDLTTVQAAVGRCLFPVERLGAPFRTLRAFQTLLSMDTGDVSSGLVLRDIPKIVVLHHLYSRAPPGLASPHTRTGLSPSQYSLWLDNHSAEAAGDGVKAALDACSSKAKGQQGFDEVYPLMMALCDK